MRKIVIIGNGISGITVARNIRKLSEDKIIVISKESDYFFSRTALMYVYMGHMKFEHIQPYENWFWKKNKIEEQLNTQTVKAMNNPDFIRLNHEEESFGISEIFRWYTQHFTKDGSIREYINNYRTEKIPPDYKISYYSYDWSLNIKEMAISENVTEGVNLQEYTPSALFDKGQWELKLFHNLYTQNKSFNASGKKVNNDSRETWFTSIYQFTYGINKRINIGADLWWKSVSKGDPNSSPLEVLRFRNTPTHRTAITSFGPKIKLAPIKTNKYFSIQSSYLFPIAKDMEGRWCIFL